MSSNYCIKKIISEIKSELNNQYPNTEIESFISLIFENLFNYSRTQIHLNQDTLISHENYLEIKKILSRLKDWEPIQYIIGFADFYGLKFKVNTSVLIPRQETEELVDWIIHENKKKALHVLDIGTGSGCIAISLAKNLVNSTVKAYDISQNALSLAMKNAEINSTEVIFTLVDILDKNKWSDSKFDIIVSNPPYVRDSEKTLMQKNVLDYEPQLALFVPDKNPLLYYKKISEFATKQLNKHGKLYFEINESYAKEVAEILKENNFSDLVIKKDLNGKDRMIKGIKN